MSVRLLSCFSTSEELAQHWKENERMEEVSVTMNVLVHVRITF